MGLLALVVCARLWVGLSVSATALRVMRGGFRLRPTYWVPATTAFEIVAVSIALAVPIMACILFLIVPGVILALRWSQAAFLILDSEAAWLESAEASAALTRGRYIAILVVWLIVGGGFAVAAWLGQVSTEIALAIGTPPQVPQLLGLIVRAGLDAFGLVVTAALYNELSAGAFER